MCRSFCQYHSLELSLNTSVQWQKYSFFKLQKVETFFVWSLLETLTAQTYMSFRKLNNLEFIELSLNICLVLQHAYPVLEMFYKKSSGWRINTAKYGNNIKLQNSLQLCQCVLETSHILEQRNIYIHEKTSLCQILLLLICAVSI